MNKKKIIMIITIIAIIILIGVALSMFLPSFFEWIIKMHSMK